MTRLKSEVQILHDALTKALTGDKVNISVVVGVGR
jgi:hypothetical protein